MPPACQSCRYPHGCSYSPSPPSLEVPLEVTSSPPRVEQLQDTGYGPPRRSVPGEQLAKAIYWPLWQRVLFRFFFVYLALQIAPWDYARIIPGVQWLLHWYDLLDAWAVRTSNARLFHVRETLVPVNGSGDTSYAWAQMWLYLSIAAVACIAWSLADRKRPNYMRLMYWLRLVTRYYIAAAALSYGIIKLLLL